MPPCAKFTQVRPGTVWGGMLCSTCNLAYKDHKAATTASPTAAKTNKLVIVPKRISAKALAGAGPDSDGKPPQKKEQKKHEGTSQAKKNVIAGEDSEEEEEEEEGYHQPAPIQSFRAFGPPAAGRILCSS